MKEVKSRRIKNVSLGRSAFWENAEDGIMMLTRWVTHVRHIMVFFVDAHRPQLHGFLAIVDVVQCLRLIDAPNSSPQQVHNTGHLRSVLYSQWRAFGNALLLHWSLVGVGHKKNSKNREWGKIRYCVFLCPIYTARIGFGEGNLFWDFAPFLNLVKCDHWPLFRTLYGIRGSTFSARFGYPECQRYLPSIFFPFFQVIHSLFSSSMSFFSEVDCSLPFRILRYYAPGAVLAKRIPGGLHELHR